MYRHVRKIIGHVHPWWIKSDQRSLIYMVSLKIVGPTLMKRLKKNIEWPTNWMCPRKKSSIGHVLSATKLVGRWDGWLSYFMLVYIWSHIGGRMTSANVEEVLWFEIWQNWKWNNSCDWKHPTEILHFCGWACIVGWMRLWNFEKIPNRA